MTLPSRPPMPALGLGRCATTFRSPRLRRGGGSGRGPGLLCATTFRSPRLRPHRPHTIGACTHIAGRPGFRFARALRPIHKYGALMAAPPGISARSRDACATDPFATGPRRREGSESLWIPLANSTEGPGAGHYPFEGHGTPHHPNSGLATSQTNSPTVSAVEQKTGVRASELPNAR
jgi:hypothetical protein